MTIQIDLPDWSTFRNVTQSPMISFDGPANAGGYTSAVIDVGVYTFLNLACHSASVDAVFSVTINFYDESGALSTVYTYPLYVYGNGRRFTESIPTFARWMKLTILEITATGESIVLTLTPTNGPSNALPIFSGVPDTNEASVGAGSDFTFDPNVLVAALWHVYAYSLAPSWTLRIEQVIDGTPWTTALLISSASATLPLSFYYRGWPRRYRLRVTNDDASAHEMIAFMAPIHK